MGTGGRLIARMLQGAWRATHPSDLLYGSEIASIEDRLMVSGAAPLVWWRIRATPLAATPLGGRFRDAFGLSALHAEKHALKTAAVLGRLENQGVTALVFKGCAIARHYEDTALRPYRDLDLIVDAERLADARETLDAAPPLNYPVDLHEPSRVHAGSLEELLAHAEPSTIGGCAVRYVGAEDHLRLLALHALGHGVLRPVWLIDLAVVAEGIPAGFDWARCLGRDRRRAEWTLFALALAHCLLGAEIGHTPAAAYVRRVPRWLTEAVLRAWERGEDPGAHGPVFESLVARATSGGDLRREMRLRWDRPIQSTLELRAPFSRLPRWPVQMLAVLRRLPELLRAVRKHLGRRVETGRKRGISTILR